MVTMHYPAEIRPVAQVPNLPGNSEVNERELTMARMLIDQLSTPFDPTKFEDEYRKRLMSAISDKINGQQIVTAPEPQRANVVNLMEALQASLEHARATAVKDAAYATPATATKRKKSRAKSGRRRYRHRIMQLPIVPMTPVSHDEIPSGEDWGYQFKWDGVRIIAQYEQ